MPDDDDDEYQPSAFRGFDLVFEDTDGEIYERHIDSWSELQEIIELLEDYGLDYEYDVDSG